MNDGTMGDGTMDAAREARLRAAADALPREAEPARDLWPEIRARIEDGRVRPIGTDLAHAPTAPRRFSRASVGIAAAAVLLLTVGITAQVVNARAEERLTAAAAARAFATVASYERSSAELATTLELRGASLDPRTRAVLERSLRAIDVAIAEARGALDADPSNPAVQAFVAAAYRQKIDFLRRANDVAVQQGP